VGRVISCSPCSAAWIDSATGLMCSIRTGAAQRQGAAVAGRTWSDTPPPPLPAQRTFTLRSAERVRSRALVCRATAPDNCTSLTFTHYGQCHTGYNGYWLQHTLCLYGPAPNPQHSHCAGSERSSSEQPFEPVQGSPPSARGRGRAERAVRQFLCTGQWRVRESARVSLTDIADGQGEAACRQARARGRVQTPGRTGGGRKVSPFAAIRSIGGGHPDPIWKAVLGSGPEREPA
jgi:hypothetical protein